jgi:branched-chain amino acid transport system ATP-binding protein
VALDDVTFEVAEGSRTGLIGPNGAGKTTLFNVLSGLTRPKSGRVHLRDHDVTLSGSAHRAALGLGRTFQVPSLVQDMTVAENVLLGRHLRMGSGGAGRLAEVFRLPGWWREERRNLDIAREVAGFCGVGQHWGTVVGSLPFGVQRLVEIARAVCSEPVVLALDEPAAGLDEAETVGLGVLLRRVQVETGITVLVIEHDMDMVMDFCDQLFVLDFGRLIASGTPAEIQRNQAVLEAYLGVQSHA